MGLDPATWGAIASLVVGAYGASESERAQNQQRREQKKARNQQLATNAQQAAAERRAQIREERIRRARVMQSSENTGVTGSSGTLGATGNLSTQLATNVGSNLGAINAAQNLSNIGQNIADAQYNQALYGGVSQVGLSIFSATGGFNQLEEGLAQGYRNLNPAPVTERSFNQ